MGRVEKTVFISYRRTNIPWALAIFQNLTQNGYDVFFDFNGIASGDFERVILGNITARAHFLVLLTPSALERCGNPADLLRREIETALASQRNIVPLMLEGFDFGTPNIASQLQLIGALAALKRYNALSIPPEYFLEAMGRLRDRFLNVPLTAVLHPVSRSVQEAATEQKAAADAAPAVQEEELTAQQWFERGLAATNVDEQVRFYTEAIRLKPDYAEVYNNRGIARRAKGDVEGALHDYTEAIRLKPDYASAYDNRGNARRDEGDGEGAQQDYNEAIRPKPASPTQIPSLVFVFGVPVGDNDSASWAMILKHYGPNTAYSCDIGFYDDDRKNIEHEWLVAHPDVPYPPTGLAGESQKHVHVDEASPEGSIGSFQWNPLDSDSQHYTVSISCRDGVFVEKWEVTRVDGILRSAVTIEHGPQWMKKNPNSSPVVFRYEDPEFIKTALATQVPKTRKGRVVNPAWKPSHRFDVPAAIIDSNGNLQVISAIKLPDGNTLTDFGSWNILTKHFGDNKRAG
jgi:tetratricopeptide (TPR) repeat protein